MGNNRRLKGYDYRQAGGYFVTINAYKRSPIFSSIEQEKITLTIIGEIVKSCWNKIPDHFTFVELVSNVIMPNHLHGILIIHNHVITLVGSKHASNLPIENEFLLNGALPGSLSSIIQAFKSASSRAIHQESGKQETIWQRSFYDRVIRNEREMQLMNAYIENNPYVWPKEPE